MKAFYRSLLTIDAAKIDVPKGIRQGLLIFLALFIFYLLGDIRTGLLVSMGTLSHIYLFGGPLAAKIRTALIVSVTLALAMIAGSLTGDRALLYAVMLIMFAVVPFYVFTALGVKGPSSTFFIVAFGLASYMPYHPETALHRGALVMLGGLLCVAVVYIEALFFKNKTQQQAVISDYHTLLKLMESFNDKEVFKKESEQALNTFTASSGILRSADVGMKINTSSYERRLLLHEMSQVIFAELLELNARGHQTMSPSIVDMLSYITRSIEGKQQAPWQDKVDIKPQFEQLVEALFRVDEIFNAPSEQISYKMRSRGNGYMQRLIQNLTPESMVFVMTIKYTVIMTTAVTIAMLLNIERPYWVALSAHTVMLGIHTVSSLQRASARVIGTLIGLAIMLFIIPNEPSPLIILIVIAATGGITEMIVASNYSLAMIFITVQVLLMSSIAAGHLSQNFAYQRISDVMLGVFIAVLGTLLLGRVTASSRLSGMLASIVRQEAVVFHDLFTMTDNDYLKERTFPLSQQIFNSRLSYTLASGELTESRESIVELYPVITLLEQISFILNRLKEQPLEPLHQEILSDYMLTFAHIAKQIEYQQSLEVIDLPALPQADYLRDMLQELQQYCHRYKVVS